MLSLVRRSAWLVLLGCPIASVAACVGDTLVAPGPKDAGADTSVIDAGADADEPFESGVETDAGVVADGGGNPDELDAGVIDAGKDAGTCGPSGTAPPTINSSCSSFSIIAGGGSVATVSYHLTNFVVVGSVSYCGTFNSTTYSGKLVVTKNPNATYTFSERVTATKQLCLPPCNTGKNFSVIPNGSDLVVSQTCGTVVSDTKWPYTSGGLLGARTLNYTRTSGTSTVRYYWAQD